MGPVSTPACPVCSKPVRSGTLVLYEHGDLYHVTCRARTLEANSREQVDRARVAKTRAVRLVEDAERRRGERALDSRHGPTRKGTCPVCGQSATVTDWRPSIDWVAVEGCSCRGFFVWAGVYEGRLATLSDGDRLDLAIRIRKFRAMGHEAWCTTIDGTPKGTILVRTERPDRSPPRRPDPGLCNSDRRARESTLEAASAGAPSTADFSRERPRSRA
jgi:hypothetical protein